MIPAIKYFRPLFFSCSVVLILFPLMALTQNGDSITDEEAPVGPTPRTAEGKVDFSGVWDPGFSFATLGDVPLQPWAEELYQERRANLSKDDPEARCLPAGVPRISPFPQKFVQTPDLVVILDEGNVHSYRQLFLDGRGHLENSVP